MTAPALIALAHGSRDARSAATIKALVDETRAMRPDLRIEPGSGRTVLVEPDQPLTIAMSVADREPLIYVDPDTAWAALEGRLPINPSGGLKSRGHPLAATGLAQIVECVWQLTGRAQGRQLPNAHRALAHSIGGLATNNWVTLLERV